MALLTRPSVVLAIVFGCFAILIPRVFLPLFRTKPPVPSHNSDDPFRRPPLPISPNENSDTIQHIPGTPPHMRGAHPSMRMHHPGAASGRQQPSSDHSNTKSIVTLALPMYTVGIGIFFIYTCCKYWSKKSCDENQTKKSSLKNNLLWNNDKRKVTYDTLDKDSEEEEENKEEFYAGLDPGYVEYLKSKKQKALEAERAMTDEQKQMHYALEEMKKSLSFISSKLVTKESRDGNEIIQLQERLTSTEAQMCKILSALDAASGKVNETTKESLKIDEEVQSSEGESLSASDEEDVPNQIEEEEDEHIPSESLSSSNASAEEDQSTPTDEQNRLTKRKHQ